MCTRRMVGVFELLLLSVFLSCTSPPSDTQVGIPGHCFGLDNSFSGQLSDEERARVPEELQSAYYVEAVQDITAAALVELERHRVKVAEETHGGVCYVAFRDMRDVQFDNGVFGMMIVIERYRVRD